MSRLEGSLPEWSIAPVRKRTPCALTQKRTENAHVRFLVDKNARVCYGAFKGCDIHAYWLPRRHDARIQK